LFLYRCRIDALGFLIIQKALNYAKSAVLRKKRIKRMFVWKQVLADSILVMSIDYHDEASPGCA